MRRTGKHVLTASLVCAGVILSSSVGYAGLPSLEVSHPGMRRLQAELAADPTTTSIAIFADKDPQAKVIYVAPANIKAESGLFRRARVADCESYAAAHSDVYALQRDEHGGLVWERRGQSSAYFDYAVRPRLERNRINKAYENEIKNVSPERTESQEHACESVVEGENKIREYESAARTLKAMAATEQSDADSLSRKIETLTRENVPNLDLSHLVEERKHLQRQRWAHEDEAWTATQKASQVSLDLAAARAQCNVAPIVAEKRKALSLANLATFENSAEKSFALAKRALERLGNTTVGQVAASFALFSAELDIVARAGEKIPELRGFKYQQLPIENVEFGVEKEVVTFPDDVDDSEVDSFSEEPHTISYYGRQNIFAVDGAALSGDSETPFRGDYDQKIGAAKVEHRPDAGSGMFHLPITLAAYCSAPESPRADKVVVDDGGRAMTIHVPVFTRRTTPLFAEAIALNYDYFVATRPLSIDCDVEIERAFAALNEEGKSQDFFGSEAWSKNHSSQGGRTGVRCSLSVEPSSGDESAETRLRQQKSLVAQMEDEVLAEALREFADSWTVHRLGPPPRPEELRTLMSDSDALGAAAMCAASSKCWVADIAIKGARLLVGTNSSSRQEAGHRYVGTVSRSYAEQSFRRLRSTARINLHVEQ